MTDRVLLNHPRPYPDEALNSWLWRLARSNYIASPKILLRQIQLATYKTGNASERRERIEFQALAVLTKTSVETVYAHTRYRFASLLTPPQDASLTQRDLRPNRDFYAPVFAWCPACLADARYVRLHWHVPLVVCCLAHKCWLVERCPICQMQLKEEDILTGSCPICRFSLQHAELVPVPEEDLLLTLQASVLQWLYEPDVPQALFPDVPVAVLSRVLQGLRYIAQRAGSDWHFHHVLPGVSVPTLDILAQRRLSLVERAGLYTTAVRGLLNWPQGFYAFLDAYRTRPAEKEDTGLRREFGTLYISWITRLWKNPAFDFVQQAFNDYLVEQIPVYQIVNTSRIRDYPDLLNRVQYLDLKGTVRYLKSSVYSVYRLVEEHHLTPHYFEADAAGVWFDRHDLARVKQRWEQYLPFLSVVRQLGVSPRLARELLKAQLLQRVPAEAGLKQQGSFVERDSLDTLLSRLKRFTTAQAIQEHSVSLLEVCIYNGSVKMDLAQVLNRILAGKLSAYHPDKTLLPLSNLWFMPQDVQDLARTVKTEFDWFTKQEVRAYLGIGQRVMRRLLSSHMLLPVLTLGRKQFFSRPDVYAIRKECIFMTEVQAILGVPPISIVRLMRLGILTAKTLSIFDRDVFMRWHQQYILMPELKKLLTDMQRHEQFQRAGVKPVVRFPVVYSREEVMALLENEQS